MVLSSTTKSSWWQSGLLSHAVWIYFETFSLVAKLNSVWVILSCSNIRWMLKMHFMESYKKRFLHEIAPKLSLKDQSGKVCRLKKVLYGLKQSPRALFSRFSQAILKTSYKRCHANHTLFIKRNGSYNFDCLCKWYCYNKEWYGRGGKAKEISMLSTWN